MWITVSVLLLTYCFFCVCVCAALMGMRGLRCVMDPARGHSEGGHLSGPAVWVSGWHHLLPASRWLLGLLPISQGDTHELTYNFKYFTLRIILHGLMVRVCFTNRTRKILFKNNSVANQKSVFFFQSLTNKSGSTKLKLICVCVGL